MDGRLIVSSKFVDSDTEEVISQLAQDETGKRQYYRPVYSLHKWWARRPGALFRSIILSAVGNANSYLFSKINNSLSVNSDYFLSHDLKDVVILDPFMGGGTTLAEANRLGAKVIGCDLNPVSFWVVRETLKPIDLKKLGDYFKELEETAGEKIKSLYKTTCTRCGTEADSIYIFWLRYISCLSCGERVHLFKRTLLNEGEMRTVPLGPSNPATVFCPKCFRLNKWTGGKNTKCEGCGHIFDPQKEITFDKGYYSCSNCHTDRISLIQTLETQQKLNERLLAIEYWCPICQARLYKSPDDHDLKKMGNIEKEYNQQREQMLFPRQKILEGDSSVRWRHHNYEYYYEIFNARQLLAFEYLVRGIKKIPEEEYQYSFFTAFSNSLEYNNMMTPYNYPHRKLHHLFNYHAMPLTTTPVENAVWGLGEEGAGTFTNCYRRYIKAKEYCDKPFDKFKDLHNKIRTIWAKSEKVSANFVSAFDELKYTERGTMLLCKDSAHLSEIPDKSVDFVITDPPYYDSIHYSELSNFFYVWLSALVDHPYFKTQEVPTEREAIVNNEMNKGEQEFADLLSSVFKECCRTLKDEGNLIFTFHHTRWEVWWMLLNVITNSGFRVTDYFPVMSEYKVNPHIRNKQAMDMDLVLVCQKKSLRFEPLSSLPTDIFSRVLGDLSPYISNNSDNKLFLHFMGELLKTASSAKPDEQIDYEWFSNILTKFEHFVTQARKDRGHKYIPFAEKEVQLRLFEEAFQYEE